MKEMIRKQLLEELVDAARELQDWTPIEEDGYDDPILRIQRLVDRLDELDRTVVA